MSVIDDYLAHVQPRERAELERIRAIAHDMLPGCEEIMSYSMPTIRYKGRSMLGFAAHKQHIGIYPYSGSVISRIPELKRYETTKSAIHEQLDDLLPQSLIEQILTVRLQIAARG